MKFWRNWSDGKTWLMGIVGALITAALIAVGPKFFDDSSSGSIPGGTGWVFGGDYNIDSRIFAEGPYFSMLTSSEGRRSVDVELGDTIRLNVSRPVVIVNYKDSEAEGWEISPITVGKVNSLHLTGINLAAGTPLVVRDVSRGHWEGNPQAALWLRVIHLPE